MSELHVEHGSPPAPGWVRDFLEGYAETGNIIAACDRAGTTRWRVRRLRESSARFHRLMKDARARFIAKLEGQLLLHGATDYRATQLLLARHVPKLYNPKLAAQTTVNVAVIQQAENIEDTIRKRLDWIYAHGLGDVGHAALNGERLNYAGDIERDAS